MSLPAPDPDAVALITGASSGLGDEFARRLAAGGHGVALVARRADRLDALAARLRQEHGVRAEVLACDLTDAAARAELPGRLGRLGLRADVLVNNAGFAVGGPFHESDLAAELDQLRLLCEAPLDLMHRVLGPMIARGQGAVLNVASFAGMHALPNSAGYAAAKAHLLALSEAVHAEVRKHGVTVTALCPGPVRTELFDKHDHPAERAPGPAWMDAGDVVDIALDGLRRGKRVVVPGARMRAVAAMSRVAPHAVSLRVLERFFR